MLIFILSNAYKQFLYCCLVKGQGMEAALEKNISRFRFLNCSSMSYTQTQLITIYESANDCFQS